MRIPGADDQPIVLDGGLATELEARGADLSDHLWSARLLADAPERIEAAHTAFFRAGARIATSASYQASFSGFAARGVGTREAAVLLRRSVSLARDAGRRVLDEPFWTAASVGPYGAALADGSEYRGRYGVTEAELIRFHRPRLEALAEAEPDVFAVETVPDVDEAAAVLQALEGIGIPAWLSYTISSTATRAGQPLHEAFSIAAGHGDVVAVGVNCCSPEDAEAAVPVARRASGKPVVVYPNSGEGWDPRNRAWVGPHRFSAARAARWYEEGARIIGGCCRVGPEAIAALARDLSAHR